MPRYRDPGCVHLLRPGAKLVPQPGANAAPAVWKVDVDAGQGGYPDQPHCCCRLQDARQAANDVGGVASREDQPRWIADRLAKPLGGVFGRPFGIDGFVTSPGILGEKACGALHQSGYVGRVALATTISSMPLHLPPVLANLW
jgi:hypothetical protein